MKILIAEDYSDTATAYKYSLDDRGHKVTIASDGDECLKVYHDELHRVTLHSDPTKHILPFDVVFWTIKCLRWMDWKLQKKSLL